MRITAAQGSVRSSSLTALLYLFTAFWLKYRFSRAESRSTIFWIDCLAFSLRFRASSASSADSSMAASTVMVLRAADFFWMSARFMRCFAAKSISWMDVSFLKSTSLRANSWSVCKYGGTFSIPAAQGSIVWVTTESWSHSPRIWFLALSMVSVRLCFQVSMTSAGKQLSAKPC